MRTYRYLQMAVVALCAASWCVAAQAEESVLNLWISYNYAGEGSYSEADFQDAEKLLLQAQPETKNPYHAARTLNAMGMTYAAVGDYDGAEGCYRCALKLLRKNYGKRSRDVPMVLNNLGDLYYIAGRENESRPLYREALDILERDQRHIEVCHGLNGMALLHNDDGEYVQTEKLLKRGIRIHEKASRREDPNLATLRVNLGALCTNLGRYDEAEVLFEKAKYIQDKVLRPNHPDKAIRLHAYAGLLVRTDRIKEARKAKDEAEAILAEQARTNPMARANQTDAIEQASAPADSAETEAVAGSSEQTQEML